MPEVGDPGGAGVLPLHVDLPLELRGAGAGAAGDVGEVLHVGTGRLEQDHRDLAEQQLLGEVLRADGEVGAVEVHVGDRAGQAAAGGVTTRGAQAAAGQRREAEQGRERGECASHGHTPFGRT